MNEYPYKRRINGVTTGRAIPQHIPYRWMVQRKNHTLVSYSKGTVSVYDNQNYRVIAVRHSARFAPLGWID